MRLSVPTASSGTDMGTGQVEEAGGEWVACHRAVVACTSPVLRAMLEGGWRETHQADITLRGVQHEVLRMAVRWMYGADVAVPAAMLVPLWECGDQYALQVRGELVALP